MGSHRLVWRLLPIALLLPLLCALGDTHYNRSSRYRGTEWNIYDDGNYVTIESLIIKARWCYDSTGTGWFTGVGATIGGCESGDLVELYYKPTSTTRNLLFRNNTVGSGFDSLGFHEAEEDPTPNASDWNTPDYISNLDGAYVSHSVTEQYGRVEVEIVSTFKDWDITKTYYVYPWGDITIDTEISMGSDGDWAYFDQKFVFAASLYDLPAGTATNPSNASGLSWGTNFEDDGESYWAFTDGESAAYESYNEVITDSVNANSVNYIEGYDDAYSGFILDDADGDDPDIIVMVGDVSIDLSPFGVQSAILADQYSANGSLESFTGTEDDGNTDDFAGWAETPDIGTIEAVTTANANLSTIPDGTYAVELNRLIGGAANTPQIEYTTTLIADQSYTLTFQSKSDGTGTAEVFIRDDPEVDYLQDDDSWAAGFNWHTDLDTTTGTAWSEKTVTFKAPTSGTYVIGFRAGTDSSSVYLDHMQVIGACKDYIETGIFERDWQVDDAITASMNYFYNCGPLSPPPYPAVSWTDAALGTWNEVHHIMFRTTTTKDDYTRIWQMRSKNIAAMVPTALVNSSVVLDDSDKLYHVTITNTALVTTFTVPNPEVISGTHDYVAQIVIENMPNTSKVSVSGPTGAQPYVEWTETVPGAVLTISQATAVGATTYDVTITP